MNAKDLALSLHNREYLSEITDAEAKAALGDNLLVIFGHSDDNIELRGAVTEEISAWNGTTIWFGRDGNLPDAEREDCPKCRKQIEAERKRSVAIQCLWDINGYSWFIQPDPSNPIPFEPFDILEDGEKFCRGIVIDTKHLPIV